MATIKQFKQEIANLVKAQKAAKNINDCSSVYYNRGRLHAMYVAYYILKHKLIGEAMNEYLAKVIKEWKSLETQGWSPHYFSGRRANSKLVWRWFESNMGHLRWWSNGSLLGS